MSRYSKRGEEIRLVAVLLSYLSLSDREDVRVTSVGDRHNGNTIELTAGSSQIDVVAWVVVDVGLGQHSVVLELRAAQSGAVGRDQQELSLATSQRLQGALQTESILSRLDDQLELAVDSLCSLGTLLGGHKRNYYENDEVDLRIRCALHSCGSCAEKWQSAETI